MIRRLTAAAAAASLLAGCCDCFERPFDLKAEIAARSARLGQLDPLPQIRPTPQASYTGARLPDPFYPEPR